MGAALYKHVSRARAEDANGSRATREAMRPSPVKDFDANDQAYNGIGTRQPPRPFANRPCFLFQKLCASQLLSPALFSLCLAFLCVADPQAGIKRPGQQVPRVSKIEEDGGGRACTDRLIIHVQMLVHAHAWWGRAVAIDMLVTGTASAVATALCSAERRRRVRIRRLHVQSAESVTVGCSAAFANCEQNSHLCKIIEALKIHICEYNH